jgi:hypothetical protein
MEDDSNIGLTINFNDPEADAEELDEEVQRLLRQMRDIDEVEAVDRVLDPNPPEGNKAVLGFIVGMLTAQVNPNNVKSLMGFLRDRLSGKAIELEIESHGKKLTVKAHSQAELIAAIEAAQKFISS